MIKSGRIRCAVNVACIREKRNASRILVGKPEGKKKLGRPTCRWQDNVKMNVREVGWVWTGLIKLKIGQVEGSCEQDDKPSGSIKCCEIF
jgi:hypothetical protein